jgi:hypothetical protein
MPYFRFTLVAFALAIGIYARDSNKPDFSGKWKLVKVSDAQLYKQLPSEVYTFNQQPDEFRAKMQIKDGLGERTFDIAAKTDGKPYDQKCADTPCTMTAKWDGKTLVWSIEREVITQQGKLQMWNGRKMHLSDDGHTITSERTARTNGQERQWTETWERQ